MIAVCIYRLVMISIKWSETAQKNTLASADVIVTQLLCYYMPLLYFVCNHLIFLFERSNRSFAFNIDCRHFYHYSFNTRRHTNTVNNFTVYRKLSEFIRKFSNHFRTPNAPKGPRRAFATPSPRTRRRMAANLTPEPEIKV